MPVRLTVGGRVPIKVWTKDVDQASLDQLRNIAALPFVYRHVAAMPDVHLGIGATVGAVIATKGAVVPAAVGVDIGCGMAAVELRGLRADELGDRLPELRRRIEAAVPVGFDENRSPDAAALAWPRWGEFSGLHRGVRKLQDKAMRQMGSLGGGNHFIEVCRGTDGTAWVMLHSGSRNIGNRLAECHIEEAKGLIARLAEAPKDPDLAWYAAGTPEYDAYLRDLLWAQDYAAMNRRVMLGRVLAEVASVAGRPLAPGLTVNCHHNFAALETHFGEEVLVTRKGAVRARRGEYGIIPGSMGTRSYIVRGLGNPESFESCSHGAGRRMSRNAARKRFTAEDLAAQTAGVECRKDAGVVDEIPEAYKPIERVMADQADLVEVAAELKQVLCVKG
ncbi:MAG: RtcB family protein [Elusimicrobia bacterium]|nr:RtcB family protein [Elusimicrobiota bacterium]